MAWEYTFFYVSIITLLVNNTIIAESFLSLLVSLRSTLSEATGSSVDHMTCFGDAAGRLQETGNVRENSLLFFCMNE
ncbi:hypothetical protein Bca101_003926 [Brassica carinata]